MMSDKSELANFSQSIKKMIATSDTAYSGRYFYERHRTPASYTVEEAERITSSGTTDEKIKLSHDCFEQDSFYQRIVHYYATVLRYYGILIPQMAPGQKITQQKAAKNYNLALRYIEKMKLPTFLVRCATRVLVDGGYYGLLLDDKDEFIVFDLPGRFCRTRFKDLKGNDILEFNLTFFNTIIDQDARKEILSNYPKEIRKAYYAYRDGKSSTPWYFVKESTGICFTFLENNIPLFVNTIPASMKYDDMIDTELRRNKEEIKKILVQKIPHNGETLLFEPEEAEEMHTGAVGMMKSNDTVSVLTTYCDVDVVTSKTTGENTETNVTKMLNNIYAQSGTSSQLFSSSSNSSVGLSIKNDAALMMILADKFSNFITNLLNEKFSTSTLTLKYQILPVNSYDNDYADQAYKNASNGYSWLIPSIAAGVNQLDLVNIKDLENNLLKLQDVLIPLSSSYTQSSDQSVGAPKKDEDKKADKTVANEDSLSNQGGSE
jgi:hypothetical protein